MLVASAECSAHLTMLGRSDGPFAYVSATSRSRVVDLIGSTSCVPHTMSFASIAAGGRLCTHMNANSTPALMLNAFGSCTQINHGDGHNYGHTLWWRAGLRRTINERGSFSPQL
eukprot:SAG11_NODE_21313_length_427_cov_2.939024_1_plen_113_part_01